jgi:hypothetical protein
MAGPDDRTAVTGALYAIVYASRPNGERLAEMFYESLSRSDQAKVNNLLRVFSEAGRLKQEKFKRVESDLFAFKSFRIRIGCYRSDNCWYLLDGFEKKCDDWPEGKVTHCLNLLREHRGH